MFVLVTIIAVLITFSLQKMALADLFRITLKILVGLVHILYIPLFIKRLFLKSKQCPHIDNSIVLLSANDLAENIRKKQVTCVSAIKAYIKRVTEVNPIINAVIENRFEEALKEAESKDSFLTNTDLNEDELRVHYPLFGVPLTVKCSMAVKGMAFNAGSNLRNVKAEEDAVVVKMTRDAGAIPLLISNTPELCMNWETTNKVLGTTLNPYDTTKTVGGSSGGECALLSCGASVIGLGSDIAGSLRLPAHFCGVFGHKPSPGIVPPEGHFPSCKDAEAWERIFTLGPLARCVDDLSLLLKCIVKPDLKAELKLDEPVNLENIRVYYINDYESMMMDTINKNVKHAMQRVTSHLAPICKGEPEKVNHKLLKYAAEFSFIHLLSSDGIDNIFNDEGEGVYSELFRFFTCRSKYTIVPICYGLYKRLLYLIFKNHTQQITDDLNEMRNYLVKLLDNNGVLICPTFPNEAHQHHDIYRKVFNAGYLSIFNSFGFPVTNCPVLYTKEGLPVGLQIAAAPNCDRLTLAVAKEIEKAFGGWQIPDPQIPKIVT